MKDNNDIIEQIFNETLPQYHGSLHNHITDLLEIYDVSNVNLVNDDEFYHLLKQVKTNKGIFDEKKE